MKRLLLSLTLFLLMVALAGPVSAATRIIVSNPMSAADSQMWNDTGRIWVEAMQKKAGNELKFDIHHGGEIISGFGNQPKGIGGGMADFGSVITTYNPSEFPMDMISGAVHPSVERSTMKSLYMSRIMFEEIPAWPEQYTKLNLYRLFILGATSFQLFSTRPVEKLEDFKGLKVRCYGTYQPKAMKAAEAVPVTMSYAEVLDGLQKKVIDATLNNPINGRDGGYGDVTKHLTIMGMGLSVWLDAGLGFVFNLDKWNKLTPDMRKAMLEEAKDVEMSYAKACDTVFLPKALEDLKAKGVTIHQLPKAEKEKWAANTPDFYAELSAQLDAKKLPGTQAIKRFKELYAMPESDLAVLYEKVWAEKLASVK